MDKHGGERTPRRVVVAVSRKSPHWAKAWASGEEMVALALRLMEEKHLIPPGLTPDDPCAVKLLATERWDIRTYVVFDVFHDTYDPDTAHLPGENDLPVISVFLGRTESAGIAGRPMANKVNSDVRALHNSTGPDSRLSFFVDHADGKVPFYPNPRTSCKSSNTVF
ncbi:hypothetical protein CTA2_11936 [Colletotrichum tanaceti]|uniref:Uncharacterized protein n=1 Tax=Colletotrichum tanaceti TaxID=1306861 RepID=A0A4U6XT55_9PEZI|nr:hypothetical protein CTA2_11936 [Colletotrichum tanaceti]TKW59117.1 hypothetical protein CTA1_906 [Colletotrichum tanaceti]